MMIFTEVITYENLIDLFQKMVGCLQHLVAQTRQDLIFSVNQLGR